MTIEAILRKNGLGAGDALAVAAAGSLSGWACTYVVKHYLPALWLFWFVSGALIAFALAVWRPALWLLAAAATVTPVILQTALSMPAAAPTASALAAGFAFVWSALTVAGALAGRLLSRVSSPSTGGAARSPLASGSDDGPAHG